MDFGKRKNDLAIVCLLVLSGCLLAYRTAVSAQEDDYRLGARDVVTLTVYAGGEEQLTAELTVTEPGQVTVPLLGPVRAGGLTVKELEKQVGDALARDYFVDPQVTVNIKEYHSLVFSISGAVQKPGMYEMDSQTTILELVAKAGGVQPDHGHLAYVIRKEPEVAEAGGGGGTASQSADPLQVDLIALLDRGDMQHNLVLATGDVVHIPRETELDQAESRIYVEGEVKNPGVYAFQPGLTALNACIMAGGFDRYAAPNRAWIVRRKDGEMKSIPINLEEVKKGRGRDIALEPGDLIHIPETWL